MTFRMRPAREEDLEPLYQMAKLTGGGLTNLPPDRAVLARKLAASRDAFGRHEDGVGDDLYLMTLENAETGEVRGTCQLFAKVGSVWPFYSYRVSTLTQTSRELARSFRAEMLSLSTDLEGSSEVGGLFLHPEARAAGLGLLIARSRYLFIRSHRARFGDQLLAELRGVIDEAGGSPFWDGLAGKFFGFSFQEADALNATVGSQFIADLMPKHPIYIAMLSEEAQAVVGMPHPNGRAAMRMLEIENFRYAKYVDIFDGGPTMVAPTDAVKSIANARDAAIVELTEEGRGVRGLACTGRLADFVSTYAWIDVRSDGIAIDAAAAGRLGVGAGDTVTFVPSDASLAGERHD